MKIDAEARERLEALRDDLRTEAREAIPEAYSSRGMGEKYLKGDNEAAGAEDAADRIDAVLRDAETVDSSMRVPECPFPCGWKKLHGLAMRRGAYLATYLEPGAEVSAEMREYAILQGDALMKVCRAMVAAKPDGEGRGK